MTISPSFPTARDVDYSSRRRYVCLSGQTVGRSLASSRRHVVTSSTAALAAVTSNVPSTDRRAVVQTRLPVPSSPAAVSTRLSHRTTHPFVLHNNIHTYYSSYVLLRHCACLSLEFSLLLYNSDKLSHITHYILSTNFSDSLSLLLS